MHHKIISLIILSIFFITRTSELSNPLLNTDQLYIEISSQLEQRLKKLENDNLNKKSQLLISHGNSELKRGALSCFAFVPSGIAFGLSAITSPPYPGSGYILFGSIWSLAGATAFGLYHLIIGCKNRRAGLNSKIKKENLV